MVGFCKSKGGVNIEVQLKAQPRKYLDSVDERTRKKLIKALDGLRELKGDIVKLKGHPNHYRLKIHHYRILFSIDGSGLVQIIVVDTINTRTNIKY
jgi:mRNA-degrading endonuclease RelE of RelBE toxin-antitoxin system